MKSISRVALLIVLLCLLAVAAFCQASDSTNSTDSPARRYFLAGSAYYLGHRYDSAISFYRRALELDTARPVLSKKYWYVLVDNLGMSYGITGDLKHAEEVFRFGLSKDSTYPLFYYNLACVYAERGDLEKCIEYIKGAYRYQNNTLKGEQLPDPAADNSFQGFMKNEKFVNTLKQLKQKQ